MFQSLNETISIKSKVIEDQTDSIRKLKQVSLLSEGFVECLKSKARRVQGIPNPSFLLTGLWTQSCSSSREQASQCYIMIVLEVAVEAVLHYDGIRGSC